MNINQKIIRWAIYISVILFTNIVLLTYFKDFIIAYLEEPQHFPSFNSLLQKLYPRFAVESQRYPTSFFLEKYHQIIFRTNLLIIFITTIWYSFKLKKLKKYLLKRYYILSEIDEKTKKWLNVLFYLACVYYTYDWPKELLDLIQVKEFYKPVSFLFWQSSFPSPLTIYLIGFIYFLAVGICVFSKDKFWASIIIALLFIYQLGLLQSFEKIDHTYASFIYGISLFPLLHLKSGSYNRLGLVGIRISIGLCYLFSSLEKILIGGVSWINGEAIKLQLLAEQEIGSWLLETPFPQLASIYVLFFQFFFTFSIVTGKGYFIFTFAGILFHWGTALLINVGAYDTPWVFMYIFLWSMNAKEIHKK